MVDGTRPHTYAPAGEVEPPKLLDPAVRVQSAIKRIDSAVGELRGIDVPNASIVFEGPLPASVVKGPETLGEVVVFPHMNPEQAVQQIQFEQQNP